MVDKHYIPDDDRPDLTIDLDTKIGDMTVRDLQSMMAASAAGPAGSAGIIWKPIKDGKDAFDKGATKDLKDAKDIIDVITKPLRDFQAQPGVFGAQQPGSPEMPPSPIGEVVAALSGLQSELAAIQKRLDSLESQGRSARPAKSKAKRKAKKKVK